MFSCLLMCLILDYYFLSGLVLLGWGMICLKTLKSVHSFKGFSLWEAISLVGFRLCLPVVSSSWNPCADVLAPFAALPGVCLQTCVDQG